MSIVVIDYGMGNLASVAKALQHVAPDQTVLISNQDQAIRDASHVVLPGQGAMPDCMRYLRDSGLQETVMWAAQHRPMLGVCVGEQMMMDLSEEGPTQGLGLFPGPVRKFDAQQMQLDDGARLKVPHMGWNRVQQTIAHPLWDGIADHSYFYFVHSYFAAPQDLAHSAAVTDYGVRFTCAIARNNIFATQFHPEKSAAAGLRLYQNFTRWNP